MSDYQYRKDGWPLCPRCEEDELYSVASLSSPFKAEPYHMMLCYNCNWNGRVPVRNYDESNEAAVKYIEADD